MKIIPPKASFENSRPRLRNHLSKKASTGNINLVDTTGPERKPDFLCIGTEKAGTTWLWHWMNRHPDIGVPASKELRYFSSGDNWDGAHFRALSRFLENPQEMEMTPRFRSALAEQMRLYYGGLPAYYRIFGQMHETIVGELSPQYCAVSKSKISKIHASIPNAKIIYMLRDPVDRLLSGARMALKQDGIRLCDSTIVQYAANPMQRYLSDAATHLDNFERYFGAENIKTVLFDDVKSQPSLTFDQVCGFLGVDEMKIGSEKMAAKVNEGVPYEIPHEARYALRASMTSIYAKLEKRFPEAVQRWMTATV